MTPTIATNNKLAYGAKALGLLLLSVFLTQVLWSNVSFTELAKISQPNSSLAYLQLGATHFSTLALGHIMFALSLFLFGSKPDFVMKQLVVFSLGYMATLWLNMFHVINPSSYMINSLVPLTAVYIAGENIFESKLTDARLAIVGACGLIHGMGMASNLKESGVMTSHFFSKSLGWYNTGMELALICLAIPAFLVFSKLAVGKPYSKLFFKAASGVIVIASASLAISQMFQSNS